MNNKLVFIDKERDKIFFYKGTHEQDKYSIGYFSQKVSGELHINFFIYWYI